MGEEQHAQHPSRCTLPASHRTSGGHRAITLHHLARLGESIRQDTPRRSPHSAYALRPSQHSSKSPTHHRSSQWQRQEPSESQVVISNQQEECSQQWLSHTSAPGVPTSDCRHLQLVVHRASPQEPRPVLRCRAPHTHEQTTPLASPCVWSKAASVQRTLNCLQGLVLVSAGWAGAGKGADPWGGTKSVGLDEHSPFPHLAALKYSVFGAYTTYRCNRILQEPKVDAS